MGKLDYTNSDLKTRYETLVRDPDSNLAKITVSASEKRTRAELLDILEELFENDELMFNGAFQEKFKAILHVMIKSIDNTLDDGVAAAVATNTAKTSNIVQTTVTGNAGTVTNGVYTTGNQTIAGAKTFSGTIILSNLPTASPRVTGQLWNDRGVLKVS